MDQFRLGLTIGSGLLESDFMKAFKDERFEVEGTTVPALVGDDILIIQRHRAVDGYRPPHEIDYQSHFRLFQQAGAERIIGVQSVGSLSEEIEPGTFTVPDDFIYPWVVETLYDDERGHVIPRFNDELRNYLIRVVSAKGLPLVKESVYVQTRGPRFETPAEASMLATFGDVVGMTAASEVILSNEIEVPYATVCSVDNYVNGIGGKELTLEDFEQGVEANRSSVEELTKSIIDTLGGNG